MQVLDNGNFSVSFNWELLPFEDTLVTSLK